jgi:phosphatidyl-myo-inositol alpha-mannosyltransferase
MKIAFALDDTLDTPDGVQQYVLSLGSWLAAQGHNVHYLVGNTTRNDVTNVHPLSRNWKVRFNGNRMSIPLPVSRHKLRAFLAEQQFDVLHVQVPYSPFLAGQLMRAAPASTAIIGTFHILPYSRMVTFANRLLVIVNHGTGKRFDHMLAVSAPARDFARAVYGYQCEVLPNPIQLSRFMDLSSDVASQNIVFVGRLVARKGVLCLLQAVAYLRANKLYAGDFKVLIGGKGELRPELERYVSSAGLQDIVSFAGYLQEADKPAFLAQADIAVFPSIAGESFGIVLLEAMAAARGAVLAGNNLGYRAVMQPYTDQMFDPLNIPEFAGKLAWYLDHPEARARAAELQHDYVRRFDVAVIGKELLKVYAEALQSRPKS